MLGAGVRIPIMTDKPRETPIIFLGDAVIELKALFNAAVRRWIGS